MTITCYCDQIIDIDFDESIDLGKKPEVYEEILDGRFQNIRCSKCGTLLKPEIETHFTDAAKDLDLLFLPEKKRAPFLLGEVECSQSRVVIGYPELVEKVKLLKDGLDDRAVETIKFFLLQKSGAEEARILYDHGETESLTFHLLGIRKDEVAVTRIPMGLYEKTLASLEERAKTEEFAYLYTPPYISINKISAEKEE